MLSAEEIVECRERPPPELPSIGIKDFEPNGSPSQSYQIEQSLSEIKNIISFERVKSLNALSQAVWKPELNLAEVTHQTGSHWTYIGHKLGQNLYIYPEEALYLLETGALEIIYNGVSLSVERAYFILFDSDNNTNIAKYRVYSLLKSHGYNVIRHSSENTVTKYEKRIEVHKIGIKLKNHKNNLKSGKRETNSEDDSSKTNKKFKTSETIPMTSNNDEIETDTVQSLVDNTDTVVNFDYDVYTDTDKKHSFKKSCLQLPSYRVVIHSGEDPMPDISELTKVSSRYEDEVEVIHAVVFCDYIAFYKINNINLPNVSD